MKVGIMQPYFFPYLGYWQLLNAVDKYVIYDDVNFIKNGWINRNNILLGRQKHMITIPLDGASPNLPINQIRMTSNVKDKEKLLKTIEMAYKKAPYFNQVFPIISKVVMEPTCLISNALINMFNLVCQYLDIKTELIISSDIAKNNALKGQDKVLHICNLLGATDYINAIGGTELYDKDTFQANGIQLNFLKTNDIKYKQFNNEFIAGLSIIDVLMFNSKEDIKKLLLQFTLQ
ncbi:MAG: WbqC family protein [Alphaproteobacteria bacterium]|nr:WbqC family protein [Alphaproteobacteria bacterium]